MFTFFLRRVFIPKRRGYINPWLTFDDSENLAFILLFLKSSPRRYLTKLMKMNFKTYALFAVAAVFATSSSAQPFCTAPGCAPNTYSDHNIKVSECCRKQPDFYQCCSDSCNKGLPCNPARP
ncbi:PcF and SCR74-like cys-rich secreted peptide, putative [Phytophthora infestans T30-4]|uniref:PcF and SCR74-like cys-rich secreted peptide, putative n=1 Tax=Phytophthora infestans (strain T30-4) TaxID=403677 RepID=D0ND98_PHYIT|nr:PcF and SCR74-like cys-rich secreted peptide, putative [Phytophthora infestans T30-4]EEY56055.1 PcF and SCR74-like cys-rich secreted peptide, putative [Phytophthora infestans T30-4]|eukprot:XP_002902885.1 PcF and SCR74-like cys-rich secreted peptide, putative [Phytophthora infestans T30-4]